MISEINQIPEKKESADEEGFIPPWIGGYYYPDDAETILQDGTPYQIDNTIGFICSSSPDHKNSSDAVREAFTYARLLKDLVIGELVINIGTESNPDEHIVFLRCDMQPREIILRSPQLSLAVARFIYTDNQG